MHRFMVMVAAFFMIGLESSAWGKGGLEAILEQFRQAASNAKEDRSPASLNPVDKKLGHSLELAMAHYLTSKGIGYTKAKKKGMAFASFLIEPGPAKGLNALALKLQSEEKVQLVFDPNFYWKRPYAAASFVPEDRTLYVSDRALLQNDTEDPTLLHEMVHVGTFSDLTHKRISPYFGYLSGPAYQPDALYLDEMHAYFEDIRVAARQFNEKKGGGRLPDRLWLRRAWPG